MVHPEAQKKVWDGIDAVVGRERVKEVLRRRPVSPIGASHQ